ncbi:MAG: NAD-binding protein [Actinobacteria bacterium]|nr:NAD-binding protein [Actinomycetota bacterium]
MHIAVLGVGATGSRVARQLVSTEGVERVTVVDRNADRARLVAESLASKVRIECAAPRAWADLGADVMVVATDVGSHRAAAAEAREAGAHVVSLSDDPEEVQSLLAMDEAFRHEGLVLAVGAGFSPGLSCVLAAHGARTFDAVDEVHIAHVGTGGRACARQRRRAMRRDATDWIDGSWVRCQPGSGRELCWFPDPIGARDCYRADLPEARLLQPAFDDITRVTARLASTRRERWMSRSFLPLSLENRDRLGALRVEVRGLRDGRRETTVFGVIDRPVVAAGVVAAVTAVWAGEGRLHDGGAKGMASLVDTTSFLGELARRGVKAAVFTGTNEVVG